MNNDRIQALVIGHLMKHGMLRILLPDGITLEIGTNQVSDNGQLVNAENYAWVIASKEDRMAVLDSYNLGIRFNEESKSLIFEETVINAEGEKVKRLDVV